MKPLSAWGRIGKKEWGRLQRAAAAWTDKAQREALEKQLEYHLPPCYDPHFKPTGGQLVTLGRNRGKQ